MRLLAIVRSSTHKMALYHTFSFQPGLSASSQSGEIANVCSLSRLQRAQRQLHSCANTAQTGQNSEIGFWAYEQQDQSLQNPGTWKK